MNDTSFARWFSFVVDSQTFIILEKRNMPEHLQQLENLERAASLQSVFVDLQDAGEACSSWWLFTSSSQFEKLLIIFKLLNRQQSSSFSLLQLLVRRSKSKSAITLRQKTAGNLRNPLSLWWTSHQRKRKRKGSQKRRKVRKKPKKKEKAPTFNLKNCGSLLDIGKVKGATSMTLAWRCRFLGFARFPNHIWLFVRWHTISESECLLCHYCFLHACFQFKINL